MRIDRPSIRLMLATIVTLQCCIPPMARSGELLGRVKRLFAETKYHGTAPAMGSDGAMECLAEHIDWLEHHIDTYGSIVAKQPDIWGEARLTRHREEYERIMFQRLGAYQQTINAATLQQDGAFMAQAIALAAAASGTGVDPSPVAGQNPSVMAGKVTATLPDGQASIGASDLPRVGFSLDKTGADGKIAIEPVIELDQRSRYLKHLHELRRINEGDDTSDSPGYSLNLVRIPVSITPGKLTRQGFGAEITITAEPSITDDLMPTTFRNLVTNDVIGFLGLPLVRTTEVLSDAEEGVRARKSTRLLQERYSSIDAIILQTPFEFTEKIETHIEAMLKDDLLVQVLSESVNNWLAIGEALKPASSGGIVVREQGNGVQDALNQGDSGKLVQTEGSNDISIEGVTRRQIWARQSQLRMYFTSPTEKTGQNTQAEPGLLPQPSQETSASQGGSTEDLKSLLNAIEQKDSKAIAEFIALLTPGSRIEKALRESIKSTLLDLTLRGSLGGNVTPSGRTRKSLDPINPSAITPIIGTENLVLLAKVFNGAYYGRYVRWQGGNRNETCSDKRVDLLDARRFLQSEAEAAYELISDPAHVGLFAELANPDSMLASQIRSGHLLDNQNGGPTVEAYRHYFFYRLHEHHESSHLSELVYSDGYAVASDVGTVADKVSRHASTTEARSAAEALAWAIVVESALLNERLNLDVRKLARAKDVHTLNTDRHLCYFLPEMVTVAGNGLEGLRAEYDIANEVFKEYVRARWPIHVFAIDPVTQDQNVADVSQRKRELQFALAMGFTTGQIGANTLTQYARELYTQVETVALNRTIVGFSHGNDTFGWQFFPRVQALETTGTLATIRETLCGTSRDYDLSHRRLESGQRECVAIVLMPSFVSYADFDIRTRWFKPTNPKNTALTMKDSMKLSRAVTAMRNSRAQCAQCQHLYREGELHRMLKRVDQLDHKLPLQSMKAQVPYENTLGGFEMFNTGVTDLAPELIGWYGAPGINTNTAAEKCGCSTGCVLGLGNLAPEDKKTATEVAKAINDLTVAMSNPLLAACEGEGTSLFLVGANFSVHDTRVIAGGVCIPHVRLISRELMQVTIPSCVNTIELCESNTIRRYVSVYVATPYGVTNHLHVPVMEQPTSPNCGSSGVTRGRHSVLEDSHVQRFNAPNNPLVSQSQAIGYIDLVSLDSTGSNVRLSSLLQESPTAPLAELDKLSQQIETISKRLDQMAIGPIETVIDVKVWNPQAAEQQKRHACFDELDFPIMRRLKTDALEQWRNCRDKLPCN